MASQKRKLMCASVREICDAYAEGVLDGIAAAHTKPQAPPMKMDVPPGPLTLQIDPEGRTLESLLGSPVTQEVPRE